MSVAQLQTPLHHLEYGWPRPEDKYDTKYDHVVGIEDEEERPGKFDMWCAMQAPKTATPVVVDTPAPYVHPLARRSVSSLSQKSLQICTESLGSETGSDEFSSFNDGIDFGYLSIVEAEKEGERHDMHEKVAVVEEAGVRLGNGTDEREVPQRRRWDELTSVNYNYSISRRSPPRSFPPPLPSISRRDGPCLHMRTHRRDGRLVVEAVRVPSRNYLHAQRQGGRLLLSFIDASSNTVEIEQPQEQKQPMDQAPEEIEEVEKVEDEEEEKNCYEEEDDEEEVAVVDRGTVFEVTVSTQPQQQSVGAMKVLRSSLVINKFVGGRPLGSNAKREQLPEDHAIKTNLKRNSQLQSITAAPITRRPPPTTATEAAAAVVATTLSFSGEAYNEDSLEGAHDDCHPPLDNKLLFTSKRRNREERRCSQQRKPFFIWEPDCIATSS
ncbi:hypothetical protein B296_00016375 [Ensete ventricosum]|uniref:FAF domain-containing protein n=1 Tax=Ensete ventricosum TaxID=4639 RepID=A0A426Z2H4_ENSVE|nr:hypothetical protein B296_00016375 [Ensete ventricosum]